MSELSGRFERLIQQGREIAARIRPPHLAAWAAMALAAVALVGLGVAVVGALARPGPRVPPDETRLRIEVIAPSEPAITPGSVMEVGDLVDGFVAVPAARTADEIADDSVAEEGIPASDGRYERLHVEDPVIVVPPQPVKPAEGRGESRVSRWLGFDAPDRDYRAERDARRARRDAREERDRARLEEWRQASDDPVDRPE